MAIVSPATAPAGALIVVPGQQGKAMVVTLTLMRRSASSRSEVGIFLVDDASGRVGTLRPGDRGYAAAAIGRRMVLFDRGRRRGATREFLLPAGSVFGTYLVANGTSDRFLARNPGDQPGRPPLAFFSLRAANPDGYPHVLRRPAGNILRMEDQWRGGDRDHDDAVIRVRFHAEASDHAPPPAPTGLDLVPYSDTGRSDHDDVTSDSTPTIRADAAAGALVRFYVDGRLAGSERAHSLVEWTSDPLGDGQHIFTATAEDSAGHVSPSSTALVVTIDTAAPVVASLGLDAASDSPPVGDGETTDESVTLLGQAEPGVDVVLEGTGQGTAADGSGRFSFTGVTLDLGPRTFTVRATDLAGNSTAFGRTITRVASPASQAPVLEWNDATLEAIRLDDSTPPVASRVLAMVHSAIYDAVSTIDGSPTLYTAVSAAPGGSPEAALAAAAHRVLSYLYPAQQASLDAVLTAALARVSDGPAKTDGVTLGTAVGDSIIALRSHDGWDDFVTYDGGQDVGQWRATAPMYDVALLPQWATLDPFTLDSPSQFRPNGPPSLASQAYADAFNEVKDLGAATGGARTPEQTQIARFWADGAGSYTPPGHWNQIAEQIAEKRGLGLLEDARLFAELNLALADSAIAAWDAKYAYGSWRPITAIPEADLDGNPATEAQGDWQPFLITPDFPEYISGHSTFSAAAATILAATFGDDTTFTAQSLTLPGVERMFDSFSAAAAEAGRSRIYGGIHYEFSDQDGQATGRKIGEWVLNSFSTTTDNQPPSIIVESPSPGAATNHAVQVTGRVLDNLSGVASLTSRLDDGPAIAATVDERGRFTIPTTLPLDGTGDGAHVLWLNATDGAGNASTSMPIRFTLDTLGPAIGLLSPDVGADVQMAASVSGTVDGTGSPVTSLAYQIDGDPSMPLRFDPTTGAIDGALDLSMLASGNHTLVVTARDAAGNVETLSRPVALSAPVLLRAAVTPDDGAQDVGVTFRPQVVFSRPVDTSSLTSSSFFATGPEGAVIPATIVPAADRKSAWLFFAAALPGGAVITLHLDGSRIRAMSDGRLLDADNDGAPGGTFATTFTTVSVAALLGTSLSGRIFDPGPDLRPMTFDDIRSGPDGTLHTADDVFLRPIAGVRVFLIGLESQAVLTDAAGRFHFDAVPAGDVKVTLDGRTATNAPDGFYFPEMVMDATIRAGRANTLMGSMGTLEEQVANADRAEVYLPRLRTSILQPVSATEPTVVHLDPESAPGLSPEQRERLTITVQPGTMIGHDGQPLASARIGISLVPPELVREMLPPGLLQHTFDITIQAPGVDRFTTPLAMTFPNVFDAPPGSQVDFLSFDHATGRLEIGGTATVSPDGLTVVTDPGMGITHPGWEGTMPPGSCGASNGAPPFSPPPEHLRIHDPVVLPMATSDNAMFSFPELRWAAPPPTVLVPPMTFGCNPPGRDPGGALIVTIEVDGPLSKFAKPTAGSLPLVTQSFVLAAGSFEDRSFDFEAQSYAEMYGPGGFAKLDRDQLYGSVIHVTQTSVAADGTYKADLFTYYAYRWVDVVDANAAKVKSGDTAAFFKTLADGEDGFIRDKLIDAHVPRSQVTKYSSEKPFLVDDPGHGESQALWIFDPTENGDYSRTVQISVSDPYLLHDVTVGQLTATGKAIRPTKLSVNLDGPVTGYRDELKRVILSLEDVYVRGPDGFPGGPGDDDGNGIPDDDGEYGFPGSDDRVVTLYTFPGGAASPVTTVGQDGKPGIAGVDDDGDGTIDNGIGELGAPGSDDLDVLALTPSSSGPFLLVSSPFASQFAGFMPQDRSPGADGKPGTTDDGFSPAQLSALDVRVATEADELLAAIQADYAPISNGLVLQRDNAGADVVMTWRDLGPGLFGHTSVYDRNLAKMQQLIGTPGRTDPITGNTYNLDMPDAAQQWALAQYLNEKLGDTGEFAVGINLDFTNPTTTFAQFVANTVSHELGHTFGLNEGYFSEGNVPPNLDGHRGERSGGGTAQVRADGNAFPYDIMSNGQLGDRDLTFKPPTVQLLQAATGTEGNYDLPLKDALNLWRNGFYLVNGTYPDGGHDQNGIREESKHPSTVPEIYVTAGEDFFFGAGGETAAIGSAPVDGAGSAFVDRSITLTNEGYAPLTIEGVAIEGGASGFSIVSAGLAGTTMDPGESTTLVVHFDPLTAGQASDVLSIVSNAGTVPRFHLALTGTGIPNHPIATLRMDDNNNLGGVKVADGSAQLSDLASITNDGALPLTISSVRLVDGAGEFTLLGVPSDLAANPIELALGESFRFGIQFDPNTVGLRRSIIELTTNDPAHPQVRVSAVGTGLAQAVFPAWGKDFVAVETPALAGSFALRARSDAEGNFSFFLPSAQAYHLALFDPDTGLIAHGRGTTARSGGSISLSDDLVFSASTASDSDGDGLPDDVEFAIGTGQNLADTDRDGLSDFDEIVLESDPLGGLGAPTGVVAASDFAGAAQEVDVEGSVADPTALIAYVASGAGGLAIVDVAQPTAPVVLADLDLEGVNTDVDVDVARGLAAVAAGFAGLHIVDVSNPLAPALVTTVPLVDGASRVEVLDGLAIVASGHNLVSVDLASHEIRQTLSLGSNAITDLATEGAMIYTMDTGLNLRASILDGLVVRPRGSVTLKDAGGKLFVTDGVAYAVAVSPSQDSSFGGSGFSTVDVSDPDHPLMLSDPDVNRIQELAKIGIAANGSGLAVLAGEPKRGLTEDTRQNELDVMSVADLTNTAALITRLPMPALPRAVALAAGFAFVADDISDLQVASIVPLDTAGVAPATSIDASPDDGDPGSPGLQVLEGRPFALTTRVADDVQVRSVELIVDGQVVDADVAAPWSFFVTPPLVGIAGDVLTVQVRATDTGGNTALSNLLTFTAVADSTPPALVDTTPDPGQRIAHVPAIELTFDEGLDPARLDPSGFSLVNLGADGLASTADDTAAAVVSLSLHDAGRVLTIVAAGELAPGSYLLTVAPDMLADAAGNQVTPPAELSFTVPRVNALQAASGTPADPELASANPGQEISVVMPWGPEAAQMTFPTLGFEGSESTQTIRPFRTDPSTRTAWFIVPDEAETGDVTLFGGHASDISDLPNWSITRGGVGVTGGFSYLNGDGLYLDLIAAAAGPGRIESKSLFDLAPGDYELSFRLAGLTGSVNDASDGVTVSIGGLYSEFFHRNANEQFATVTRAITVTSATSARLVFDKDLGNGLLLDDVVLTRVDSGAVLLEDHFDLPFPGSPFPFQIVPVVSGVDVTSVTSTGTMGVTLNGLGFIEGNGTVYRFGTVEVADPSTTTGPDVVKTSVPSGEHHNSRTVLTLPLSNDAFGAISVTTAGGTSAPFVVDAEQMTATALGGTPADPGVASANPGQLATVTGTGLTTDTDFIMGYRGPNGVDGSLLVHTVFASTDHTMAQLVVPDVANGLFLLRTLGSSSAAPLQIVPQVEKVVVEPGILPGSAELRLTGRGFFDGDSSYRFGSSTLFDSDPILGPEVSGANSAAIVPFITAGPGAVQVTTPGGTSAPFGWSAVIPMLGPLLDVVFDAATGEVLVAAGRMIYRLDPATASSPGSFPIPLAVQATRAGLQLLPTPIILGGTSVPAGSLLVTAAASPDTIVAVNLDPAAGTVAATLASLSLAGIAPRSPGAVFDPASGDLFVLDGDLDRLVKVDPVTGGVVATFALPFAVDQNAGGLAIDPATGLLWVGSVASSDVAEIDPAAGTVIRLLNLASQGVGAEISGLAFDGSGSLLVSSILGVVYRLTTIVPAWPDPTLTAIDAVAPAGVPADAAVSSANAGQVITIVGTGFRRGDLQVLFPTRDELGVDDVEMVQPSVVDETGTVAQVRVPLHAATGQVRVMSAGGTSGPSSPVPLQIVPTIEFGRTPLDLYFATVSRPGGTDGFELPGSGFMSGASTIQVGGIVISDRIAQAAVHNSNDLDPVLLYASNNGRYLIHALGLSVEGPIRITTAGGWFEVPRFPFLPQVSSTFTGIRSVAEEGTPADPSLSSANAGQLVAMLGTGFDYSGDGGYVTFDAVDETGTVGTITRAGYTVADPDHPLAIDLAIEVPLLARTGLVRVAGADGAFPLQIVPTVQGVSPLVAGRRAMLEGTGLPVGDLAIRIDGQLATDLYVQPVTERYRSSINGSVDGDELVTFMVPAGIGPGVVTVTTSGGSATIRAGFAATLLPDLSPASDVGDSRETALPVDLTTGSRLTIESSLDPPSGGQQPDTDVYSLSLTPGDRLVISYELPGGQLIGYATLFDADGRQVLGSFDNDIDENGLIQRTELVVPSVGTYFLIVNDVRGDSGYGDGPYRLRLERVLPATSTLTGIESAAAAGTAARPEVPSANVGQRITITGAGLSVADPVYFSGSDHNGRSLVGVRAIPVSASPDGRSLDVIVPEGARTGKVWLSGEDSGIVFQIVPVVTGLTVSRGTLAGFGLLGTGLEDPIVVHLGDYDMVDYSRRAGDGSTFGIPLVPYGIPLGPISLSSAGGTSALFDGYAVDSIVAVSAVGTAPDPALPSANPGQTISIQGRGFTSETPILFTTPDPDGKRRGYVIWPSTVSDDGTSMTVEVPLDAVTGLFAVIGDKDGVSLRLQIVPMR